MHYHLSLLFIIFFFFTTTTAIVLRLPPNVTVPAIFGFGDSIIDAGNNNNVKTVIKCNYPPYGQDFMGGLATGRFSNGRIPTDLLGMHHELLYSIFILLITDKVYNIFYSASILSLSYWLRPTNML